MLNLDPRLLDQDKIRLEKRKKYLLIALAPLIFLFFVALFFLRTAIYNIPVLSKNYETVQSFSNLQLAGNLIEPYIPYYDRGTSRLALAKNAEDLASAESDLRDSLKQNPPESILCSIYGNLSLSLELQGDLKYAEKKFDDAIVLYNQAESVLYENNCASKSDNNSGKDEMSENTKERLQEKRESAVDAANNMENSDENDEEEQPNNKQQISEEDLRKLQEMQQNNSQRSASSLRYQLNAKGSNGYFDSRTPNF